MRLASLTVEEERKLVPRAGSVLVHTRQHGDCAVDISALLSRAAKDPAWRLPILTLAGLRPTQDGAVAFLLEYAPELVERLGS